MERMKARWGRGVHRTEMALPVLSGFVRWVGSSKQAYGFDQLCRSSIVANEGTWALRGSMPISFCTAVCDSANPLVFMTADCFPNFTFRTASLP